jgi:ABC-type dipeptide/oligopeptide/nickel transport system permease component
VLISLLVFGLLKLTPGDPAQLLAPENATPADIAETRARWGLDQPFQVQYLQFLSNAVQGDFGRSFRFSRPVSDLIGARLPATLELAGLAMVISCLVALPLGVIAGVRPNSWLDNLGTTFGLLGISMPSFWIGIMLILIFAGSLHLLPSSGRSTYGLAGETITGFYILDSLLQGDLDAALDGVRHMLLPAVALGVASAGILMRITRSAVLAVAREDFIRVAQAKGLASWGVVRSHVMRNALLPIITVLGLEVGQLLSGSIIVETVFAWPGVGSLLVDGVGARDYSLVTALVLGYTFIFVLINLAIDGVYAIVDPRIRY